MDFLSSVSLHLPAFEINCDRNEPLDGMEKLESALRTLGSKQETPVTIDISTFTKQYLLTLLRRIESLLHPDSVRLLYTEPGIYGKGEFKRLTYGVKDVVVVPEFIGEEKEGKLLLVVFLGYEAHRTLAVIEKYEPDLLIAVVGKPPYYERWDDFSVKAHRFLLSRPEVVRWEMPTRDPDGVRNGLERISEKFCDEFTNMYVSPSGTKLQTVGIYEFARVHPNARIVYAIPGEYLESYYTVGSGETWAYYLR